MRNASRFFAITALVATLAASPAFAANGDCGQPASSGSNVTTTDALVILRAGVGQDTCETCVCDVDNSGSVSATDALIALRVAVGQPGSTVNCPACEPVDGIPCTSAEFFALNGSDLDSGWTGVGHDAKLIKGASVSFAILKRCSDNDDVCETDADCGGSATCDPTCDCLGDTDCEITGPTHDKHCVSTLQDCTTDADCNGDICAHTFGPPLPLSSGGNPVCIVSLFDSEVTGTSNTETGEGSISVSLRSRLFTGIAIDQPCPRCGPPTDPGLELGAQYTCEGGQNNGATCTVEAISPDFGGTSHACPPSLGNNISGNGLAIRFSELTTGTVSKEAKLPCSGFIHQNHPDSPFGATCLAGGTDTGVTCGSNGDCGTGETCGRYCHCGYCGDDPELPCFEDSDCPTGVQCLQGSGNATFNLPQEAPNGCGGTFEFVCGSQQTERCPNTFQGTCEGEPWRACSSNAECGGATCNIEFKPCFENTITRTGTPSPLGSYCAEDPDNNQPCTSNADCTNDAGGVGECVESASRPKTVALFCAPATTSEAINSAAGLTGPGAITIDGLIRVCRCGDGEVGCDEQCDDGNNVGGDGCDENCKL